MKIIGWIVAVCWIVFWAYWLISAFSVKGGRIRWRQWGASRVGIVIVLLIVSRLGVLHGHARMASGIPLWLSAIGVVVFLAGLALAVWARIFIGRNWGMPMTEKADPELVTTGPYSRVRHPIYTGIIFGMVGTALALNVWYLIIAAVLGAFFSYSAVSEERYMTEQFPDAYPAYKRSTKMLIPYVF